MILWIRDSLTTYKHFKVGAFCTNIMGPTFFVVFKMILPDTRTGYSDTKTKLDAMKIPRFKHDISNAKLHILEQMNEISITG